MNLDEMNQAQADARAAAIARFTRHTEDPVPEVDEPTEEDSE
jgi:hypothetical protein